MQMFRVDLLVLMFESHNFTQIGEKLLDAERINGIFVLFSCKRGNFNYRLSKLMQRGIFFFEKLSQSLLNLGLRLKL
jgi:hypothetical protein